MSVIEPVLKWLLMTNITGSSKMSRILIIEDNVAISDLISLNLNVAGYESKQAFNGNEAFNFLQDTSFDLILLDIMLPDSDGFEIMEKVRNLGIPVIFLTAKNSLSDKVKGLKMGADDYIVKPFEAIEMLARIEAVLRRYDRNKNLKFFEDIEINSEERTVKKGGKSISLTLKEYELLVLFISNRNKALSREKILALVLGL